MNTGIVISFIIGGLLLISILSLNARVSENSGEAVLNMTAKKTVETVTQIMTRDFNRIGYNTGNDPDQAITSISADQVVFMADIYDDGVSNPVQITWRAEPGNLVTVTKNQNDYTLTRTVSAGPEQGTTTFAIVPNLDGDPFLKFLEEDGNETSTNTAITSIKVSITCEAPSKYGNREGYEKSLWNKTFSPPNLNAYRYDN